MRLAILGALMLCAEWWGNLHRLIVSYYLNSIAHHIDDRRS